MTTENPAMKALHELDFNIMRDGDGEIQFKMNQHTLDCFWRNHLETVRTSLLQSAKVNVLLETLQKISRMKTMPDHASNTFTLSIAHKLADDALSQFHVTEGK